MTSRWQIFVIVFLLVFGFFGIVQAASVETQTRVQTLTSKEYILLDTNDPRRATYVLPDNDGWGVIHPCHPTASCQATHELDISSLVNQGNISKFTFYIRMSLNRSSTRDVAKAEYDAATGAFNVAHTSMQNPIPGMYNAVSLYNNNTFIGKGATQTKYYPGNSLPGIEYLPDQKKIIFRTYNYTGEGYDNFTDGGQIHSFRFVVEAQRQISRPWIDSIYIPDIYTDSPQPVTYGYDVDAGEKLSYSYSYDKAGLDGNYNNSLWSSEVALLGLFDSGMGAGPMSPKIKSLINPALGERAVKLKPGAQVLRAKVTDRDGLSGEYSRSFTVSLPGKVIVNKRIYLGPNAVATKGDANRDGYLSQDDITTIAGMSIGTVPINLAVGDMDSDGSIGSADMVLLSNQINSVGSYNLQRLQDGRWVGVYYAFPDAQTAGRYVTAPVFTYDGVLPGTIRIDCPAVADYVVSGSSEKVLNNKGTINLDCVYSRASGRVQFVISRPSGMRQSSGGARLASQGRNIYIAPASTTVSFPVGSYSAQCSSASGYDLLQSSTQTVDVTANGTARVECSYNSPVPQVGTIEVAANRGISYRVESATGGVNYSGTVTAGGVARHSANVGVYSMVCPVVTGFGVSQTVSPVSSRLESGGTVRFNCSYTATTVNSLRLTSHTFTRSGLNLMGSLVGVNAVGGGTITAVGSERLRSDDSFRVTAEAKDAQGNIMTGLVYIWKVDGVERQRSSSPVFNLARIGKTGDVNISVEVERNSVRANLVLRLPTIQQLEIQ